MLATIWEDLGRAKQLILAYGSLGRGLAIATADVRRGRGPPQAVVEQQDVERNVSQSWWALAWKTNCAQVGRVSVQANSARFCKRIKQSKIVVSSSDHEGGRECR